MPRRPVAQQQVLDYLARFGPVLTQQPLVTIAEAVGTNLKSVSNCMTILLRKSQVEVYSEGRRFTAVGLPGTLPSMDGQVPRAANLPGTRPASTPPLAPPQPEAAPPSLLPFGLGSGPNYEALAKAVLAEALRVIEEGGTSVAAEEELAELRLQAVELRTRASTEKYLRDRVDSLESQLAVEVEKARTANARAEVMQDRLSAATALAAADARNHRQPGTSARRRAQSGLSPDEKELLDQLRR